MYLQASKVILLACFLTVVGNAQAPDRSNGPLTTEVEYRNGEVVLYATLLIPAGPGPFPAAVIVHGSGSSTRQNPWTTAYADALVKRGIAVLYPDKRGSGKSTGSWINSTFLELADDAIAGVKLLKADARIDKTRIGVIGFSQGGHIVPAAASRSDDISFAISISASTVPMMEQIMDEVEIMAENEGLNKAEVEVVNDINRKAIYAALTGNGFDEYLKALNAAKQGSLGGKEVVEGFPTDPAHPSRTFLHTIGDYDPIPYWKKVSVPILFVYGGKDTQIRIKKSIDRIENTLGKSEYNYSILLFHNNGHGIFREDLLELTARWILDKGVS